MVDEQPTGPQQLATGFGDFFEAFRADIRALDERLTGQLEDVRADVREDNQRVEDRLMAALQTMATVHAREHSEEDADRERVHERFEKFIKAAELAQARKDGALGVFRFVVEVVGRNARPIAQICAGAGILLGVLSGSISVAVR